MAFKDFIVEWTTSLQFLSLPEGLWSHCLPSPVPEPLESAGTEGDSAAVVDDQALQRHPHREFQQKASRSGAIFPFVKWTGQFSRTQLSPPSLLAFSAQHQLHGRQSGAKFSKHSHLSNKERRHLVPCPQRQRGSSVTSCSKGHQTPWSHCGPEP